jgi:hypothetical protein
MLALGFVSRGGEGHPQNFLTNLTFKELKNILTDRPKSYASIY